MRLESVERLRELQLKLLKKFDQFCAENQITYFAFAGTLLGAVRHKGFIPWDNDIDLAVPREDYERLIQLLKHDDASDYFRLLCYENDHDYLWQYGRICDKKTYMKTAGGYKKLGLFIDIFPLDSQGNNKKRAQKNLKRTHKCVQYRMMAYDKKYKKLIYPNTGIIKGILMKLEFNFLNHSNQEYWVKRNIKLAKKFNNERNSRFYGCNTNEKYTVVCNREYFEKTGYLDFEDMKLPAPIGYKEILTKYYGDYMKLPEKEKQLGVENMNIYLL